MSYRVTAKDTTCPAFQYEYRTFNRYIHKIAKNHQWELISITMGHYFISGYIRDKNGNYVYFSKQDWDRLSNLKWISEDILVRTAKSRKDYVGGNNHYATFKDFEVIVNRLFKSQPVKLSKKLFCRRLKWKQRNS